MSKSESIKAGDRVTYPAGKGRATARVKSVNADKGFAVLESKNGAEITRNLKGLEKAPDDNDKKAKEASEKHD